MARLPDPDLAFLGSETTLENVDKEFADWHQGRAYYYVWMLPVDEPGWINAFDHASRTLQQFLHKDYLRQPHVTVLPAGFVSQGSIAVAKLAELCKQTPPIKLQLGKLTSFISSPYLAVKDPLQALGQLRSKLRQIAVDPNGVVTDEDYVPHLTVGIYDGAYGTDNVLNHINRYPDNSSPSIRVTELALARYQTSTIKGPLETIATIKIGSGDIQLHSEHDLFTD